MNNPKGHLCAADCTPPGWSPTPNRAPLLASSGCSCASLCSRTCTCPCAALHRDKWGYYQCSRGPLPQATRTSLCVHEEQERRNELATV